MLVAVSIFRAHYQCWVSASYLLPCLLAALQFALDGCDPCSYGGVLWCFGLFDSPKSSDSTPVSGVLATRPTSRHARRLNPALYKALPV